MRNDVKVGIVLGFLVVVCAFVFWQVQNAYRGSAVDLTGKTAEPVAVTIADTIAPATPSTPATTNPPPPAATDTPPVVIPPRPMPTSTDRPDTTPALDITPPPLTSTGPPPAHPTTGASTAAPAITVTPEFDKLEKAPDGAGFYQTQSGDSQSAIAKKFYDKAGPAQLKLLADANPEVKWNPLSTGVKIKVPKPAAVATSPLTPPPVAGPLTPPAPAGNANEYTIQADDTLSKIAREKLGNAGLWRKIQEANPDIDPLHLTPGKIIKLPPKEASSDAAKPGPATRATPTPAAPVLGPNEYLIKSGDTFTSIAREKLGDEKYMDLIAKANPEIKDPSKLQIGQKIKLPPKPEAAPAKPATPATPPASSDGVRI